MKPTSSSASSSATQPPTQEGDGGEAGGAQLGAQVAAVSNTSEQPQTGDNRAEAGPSQSTSAAEASSLGGNATEFKLRKRDKVLGYIYPMTRERIAKKLDKAWAHEGVLREIENKVMEMTAFGYNLMPQDKFDKLLNDGKKLLGNINCYAEIWLEDSELTERICKANAVVLSAQILNERVVKTRDALETEAASTSSDSTSIFKELTNFHLIHSYLESCPPPWDIPVMKERITRLFSSVSCIAPPTEAPRPEDALSGDFSLEDVSLDPNVELTRDQCLLALGLSPQAAPEELRPAYKRLCLQHHPDKNPDNQESATLMFLKLQNVGKSLRSLGLLE